MSHSLNEIEAMSKRAARGAGLSWGLAEEAAIGTRWLCAFGFPGTEMLAGLLVQNDRIAAIDVSPVSLSEDVWQAPSRRMSPLIAGASLSDCATRLLDRGSIAMHDVSLPLLAIPFMGAAALRLGQPVFAEWASVRVATDGKQICVKREPEEVHLQHAEKLVFSAPAEMTGQRKPALRGQVSTETWSILSRFAQRTFAPATDESRLRGAGAGLSDND